MAVEFTVLFWLQLLQLLQLPIARSHTEDITNLVVVNKDITNVTLRCPGRNFGGRSVQWLRDGATLRFGDNGICTKDPYLFARGRRQQQLTVLRATPQMGGNYSCRWDDSPSSPMRHLRLEVRGSAQPGTADFLENLPPTDAGRLQPLRPYVSWKLAEPQAPTVVVGHRQLRPFRLRLLALLPPAGGVESPTLEWRRELRSEWPVSSATHEIGDLRPVACDRHDGLFRRGADMRGVAANVVCFEASLAARRADRGTAGGYVAVVTFANFTLRHPFRLDIAASEFGRQPLKPTAVRFGSNRTICLGDSLSLSCSAEVEGSSEPLRVVLLRLGAASPPADSRPEIVAVAHGFGSVSATLRINSSSLEDEGFYECVGMPENLLFDLGAASVHLRLQQHCRGGAAAADMFHTYLYTGLAMGGCIYGAMLVAAVICATFHIRRRRAPLLKRIRVLATADNRQLYGRLRQQSGSASPLLGSGVSRQTSVESSSSDVGVVPDVVVEVVGPSGGAARSDANREVRYQIPACPVLEVDRSKLYFAKKIGEGAFGAVFSGQLHTGRSTTDVAIKRLKAGHTEEELVALVQEIQVMKMMRGRLAHPNIIRIVGVCTKDGPFLLVTELAHHGNLRDFLVDRRPVFDAKQQQLLEAAYRNLRADTRQVVVMPTVDLQQLLGFAADVASGLEFMANIGIVHRDIAARNVLVGARDDGAEGLSAKIADFGLTRQTKESDYYKMLSQGKLPVKWLAPECLRNRIFNAKTDVWAFGILLYEIFTFGETPYPGLAADHVADFVLDGGRNSWPQHAPKDVYRLMLQCWQLLPHARPSAADAKRQLLQLRTEKLSK